MFNKIFFIVILLYSFTISAQTIETDRPDQTESSSTVPKTSLQIETGILIGFSDDGLLSERQILAPTTLVRYGLTKSLEIRLVSQFESVKNRTTSNTVNGISDLEIGAKFQILKKEGINTEIAFLSHLIIPIGSKNITLDKFTTINKIAFSHSLSAKMGMGYNVGYNYFGEGQGDLTYSLALAIEVAPKIGIYFEPYGEVINFDKHQANVDSGITYLIKNNLQLDLSFGIGLNHKMNYTSIGMSINILKDKSQ